MINDAIIDEVAEVLGQAGSSDLPSLFKEKFPDLRFSFCSEDDIHTGKPVKELEGYSIYLYGGDASSCLSLTNDPQIAHGFVIAEVYE